MLKKMLRLREKTLEGINHGYSLASSPIMHFSNLAFGILEPVFLWPWYRRIPIDRPIFIIGPYRSGTTILEEIIAAHPKVGFLSWLTNMYYQAPLTGALTIRFLWALGILDREPIHPAHNPRLLITVLSPYECEWVWSQYMDNLWDDRTTDLTADAEFSDPRFERYITSMIRRHLFAHRATRFLNKNPVNCLRMSYLHKLFPDARFINIVRDPIETILSHYRTAVRLENLFYLEPTTKLIYEKYLHFDVLSRRIKTCDYAHTIALNQEHPLLGIAHQWAEMQLAILKATQSDSDLASQLFDFRYEELVSQPETILGRLWDFIELSDEHAQQITQDYVSRLTPPVPKEPSDEEWKYLPRIQEIVAPVANRLGYSI